VLFRSDLVRWWPRISRLVLQPSPTDTLRIAAVHRIRGQSLQQVGQQQRQPVASRPALFDLAQHHLPLLLVERHKRSLVLVLRQIVQPADAVKDESLILDLMQDRIYRNDRQVKRKVVTWGLDRDDPRAEIVVTVMD